MQYTQFTLVLTSLLLFGSASAQEVISSGGNHHENSSAMISYTLGEAATFTGSSSENILTQGFHQTNLTVTGIEEPMSIGLKVFPNPTSDKVVVEFDDPQSGVQLMLFDANGRLIDQKSVMQNQHRTEFDLGQVASGNYFLKVHDAVNTNSYHIIKSN